tara:strand:- start:1 stop:228 length:228 start_codon:yes stop_codon:yes gene_type:complete
MREIESHKAEARASRILFGLGFDEDEITKKKTREFSGGAAMNVLSAESTSVLPSCLFSLFFLGSDGWVITFFPRD